MASLVGGAALGAVFGELVNVLHDTFKSVGSDALMFKSILKRLKRSLELIDPVVKDITRLNEILDHQEEETKSLIEDMRKAKELIGMLDNQELDSSFEKELAELNESIATFFQFHIPAQNRRDILQILEKQNFLCERMESLAIKSGATCVVAPPLGFTVGMDLPLMVLKTQLLNESIVTFCQPHIPAQNRRDILQILEKNFLCKRMESLAIKSGATCVVPPPPDFTIGMDLPLMALKTQLLNDERQQILWTTPGKTTLAKMLGHGQEIKGKYKYNIFFVHVSKNFNLMTIARRLYQFISDQLPEFQSDEDAINQLWEGVAKIGSERLLLILDDVWSESEFCLKKFMFDIPNYNIIVNSTTALPGFSFTCHLNPLNDDYATLLLHHSASLQHESSNIPVEAINKIVRGCSGFPLALKVISGLLNEKPEFSDHEVIFKECFMDLGSFPEDQRIPGPAIIDMWAESHKLVEVGNNAIHNLQKIPTRNLANLVRERLDMSPFKKAAVKGGSSKGKEPVIDVDDYPPQTKETRSSSKRFDPNKFRSYAAYQSHENYFQNATPLLERTVDQSSLHDTDIPKWFAHKDWNYLLSDLDDAYEDLVKEFYANAIVEEDELKCWVRKKSFSVSPAYLAEILHINRSIFRHSPVYDDLCPDEKLLKESLGQDLEFSPNGKSISVSSLPPKLRVLTIVMFHNLYPLSSTGYMNLGRALFLHDLISDVEIDICAHIFHVLRKTVLRTESRTCIPFCCLISRILKLKGIYPTADESPLSKPSPINMRTFNASIGHSQKGAKPETSASHSGSHFSTLSLDEKLDHIVSSVHELNTKMSGLTSTLHHHSTRWDMKFTSLQTQLDQIQRKLEEDA